MWWRFRSDNSGLIQFYCHSPINPERMNSFIFCISHVYIHNNQIRMVFHPFEESFVYKTCHRQNKQRSQTEWATNGCIHKICFVYPPPPLYPTIVSFESLKRIGSSIQKLKIIPFNEGVLPTARMHCIHGQIAQNQQLKYF